MVEGMHGFQRSTNDSSSLLLEATSESRRDQQHVEMSATENVTVNVN